ncbi:MAG: hypothetical protein ABIH10_01845 [Spirochaetota bacterium]
MEKKYKTTRMAMGNTAKFLAFISFVFICLVYAQAADAASLYFSPSSGEYAVSRNLSVDIYISSADQSMNAASGAITFPRDKLEVTSLSKSGSIFSLWVQEPLFSNSAGTVNFEGIVLNPGFTGAAGKIITINFRTKAAGAALIKFSSGSALANDGKGTNILTSLGDAQFSLGGAAQTIPESTTPSTVSGAPSAPQISSPTHPDPNRWYAKKDAKFAWTVPSGVTGARLLIGKIPNAIPTVTYAPAISEKEVADLDDGIWYFHVQLRNANGWGEISHFRLQIDTKPPEPFEITFVRGKEGADPSPIVMFNTTDVVSGIDYYRVKIGEGDFLKFDSSFIISNPYALPTQAPGKRTILTQAFDKAGNMTVAAEEFIILPIKTPVITYYPKEVEEGDLLEIRGTTYPDATVDIFLKKKDEEVIRQTTQSNFSGDFTLIWSPKLTSDLYEMSVQVTDERGAKSNESSPLPIIVNSSAIFKIGSLAINYLSIIFLSIAVLFALIIGGWYTWYRFTLFRKRLKKEVREAESVLHKTFDLLREGIREQIKMLEKTRTKRQLTDEEEKIFNRLRKDLEIAEKVVKKEVEDIEKEIK